MQHYQNENNLTTMILSSRKVSSWIGIGFSEHGKMVGSSAMVGWISADRKSNIVKQYYLKDYDEMQVIPDKGELRLTKAPPSIVLDQDILYLAFQAQFSPRLLRQPVILAFGDVKPNQIYLTKHTNKMATIVDFSSASKYLYYTILYFCLYIYLHLGQVIIHHYC